MAAQFNKCLGVTDANWYHFAAWASVSAGEVITGKKFEDLRASERAIMRAFSNWKRIYNEEKQIEIFASTNALIAMEMIPIGNLFIKLFCQEKPQTFSAFSNYFIPTSSAEKSLYEAFETYHKIINEKNNDKKQQLLLLASLLQLDAEQSRIDHLLDKVFWIKTRSKLVRTFFRRIATKKKENLKLVIMKL